MRYARFCAWSPQPASSRFESSSAGAALNIGLKPAGQFDQVAAKDRQFRTDKCGQTAK